MRKSQAEQLNQILDENLRHIKLTTEQATRTVAAASVEALRVVSPKKTGAYASGWRMSSLAGSLVSGSGKRKGYIVKNDDYYMLTHLLEKGHAKVNGGRVRARVHIAPVEEKGIMTLDRLLKSKI